MGARVDGSGAAENSRGNTGAVIPLGERGEVNLWRRWVWRESKMRIMRLLDALQMWNVLRISSFNCQLTKLMPFIDAASAE
jgi:hypothetical protein